MSALTVLDVAPEIDWCSRHAAYYRGRCPHTSHDHD